MKNTRGLAACCQGGLDRSSGSPAAADRDPPSSRGGSYPNSNSRQSARGHPSRRTEYAIGTLRAVRARP
jgi:hypothetical protein